MRVPWTLQCWPGFFPSPVFRDWWSIIRLSIAGAALNVVEWLSFEIITFSTSYLGTVSLAAQSILVSLTAILWHIPFSASIAVSTGIGFLIGKKAIHHAKRATVLYCVLFIIIALFNLTITLGGRHIIPSIFGAEAAVGHTVTASLPFAAIFQVFDATATFTLGVVRGFDRQSVGAWIALILNYTYAVPMALVFDLGAGSLPRLGLPGMWGALASGQAILTGAIAIPLKSMGWQLVGRRGYDEPRKE